MSATISTLLTQLLGQLLSERRLTDSVISPVALINTYGTPPKKCKLLLRRRRKSLRQGSLPSRRFSVMFESIVLEFDSTHTLDAPTLRIIYLRVMSSKIPIAIEESLSLDETLLESAFANLSIYSSSAIQPTSVTSNTTYENVDPMEIDALNTSSHSHSSSRSGKFQHKKTREKSDPMRLWASDGQPICGICKKVGHPTKKCSQNPESTQFRQVHSMSAAKTIEYAAIPLKYDTIGTQHTAAIQSIDPVQECNNVDLSSDAGASISAVPATIASGLGLQYDTSKAAAFTTTDNKNVSSLGVTYVKAMMGNTRVSVACHVVPNLAHEVIFGYPDLKRHKILIDTNTDEIRLPKSISTLSPSTPGVCAMVSSLRLPGHSHAYVDFSGPRMTSAFISTPNDTVMKKRLSVAAGVAKFNADVVATVKLANLDKNFKHVTLK
ncbi:uncharacterized protein EV154DRAFT_587193 [Mucor mucedo]|uniref:uncharacterized protein n=1 Tax=Mucor mucedo TaxID=29922 RepID=UPI00222107A7|nr:uncharacterized protein EV154DRAFT_587193 [Mucor mucedo]KAI7891932.1 hypothetical protein EV154DRAFT_587193 [Mucor mucedo]